MSPTIRADPGARTLNVDVAKMRVRSVISTIDPDRAGDVVVPTGLRNLDEFMLNPIVLWAHDRVRVPPVGVCEWLDVQPRRIVGPDGADFNGSAVSQNGGLFAFGPV